MGPNPVACAARSDMAAAMVLEDLRDPVAHIAEPMGINCRKSLDRALKLVGKT